MKIRNAIGCIILYKTQFIIVKKICNFDIIQRETKPEWDFVKGGIKPNESLESSVYRELFEETGSTNYKIILQLSEKLYFKFEKKDSNKYDIQKTTFFLVRYLGDLKALQCDFMEIGEIKLCSAEEVLSFLEHPETKDYFQHFLKKYAVLLN